MFPGVYNLLLYVIWSTLYNSSLFLQYPKKFHVPGVFTQLLLYVPWSTLYNSSLFLQYPKTFHVPGVFTQLLRYVPWSTLHNFSFIFPWVYYTKNSSLILSQVLYTTPPKCFMESPTTPPIRSLENSTLLLNISWSTLNHSYMLLE